MYHAGDGRLIWRGNFENGRAEGPGTLYFCYGSIQGNYQNGYLNGTININVDTHGIQVESRCQFGSLNGPACLKFKNGVVIESTLVSGLEHGVVKVTLPDEQTVI